MMSRLIAILIVFGLVFLPSCSKDDPDACTKVVSAETLSYVNQDRLATDITAIDNYLNSNGITNAQSEPNGVRYVITSLGTGETPCIEQSVKVKYTGKLMVSGNVFDSNSTGITFSLSRLIVGWQLVLPLIPPGSKVTLYIPSGYAYGPEGGGGGKIPSNANLIFDIELISVI